jgi:hypothetical protein
MAHGNAPYGYDVVHIDGRYQLVINEEEAKVILLIFEWYTAAKPVPIRAMCHRFNDMGIPSPKGKKWQPGPIGRMLKNETYAGIWHYGKEGTNGFNDPSHYIPVEVPAIIDRATWEIAQRRLKENKKRANRNGKLQYLLRSRAKCGECSRSMRLSVAKSGRYYRCSRQHDKTVPTQCEHKTHYRQEIVDRITWQWARNLILDPQKLKDGWTSYAVELEARTKPIQQQVEILEEGIVKHQESLDMLLDLYFSGQFDKSILMERKQRLENMLSDLTQQRDEKVSELNNETVTYEQIKAVQEFLGEIQVGALEVDETADFETKRSLIDLLNVQGTMWFEEGKRKLRLCCILGEETFIVSQDTIIPSRPFSKTPLIGLRDAAQKASRHWMTNPLP